MNYSIKEFTIQDLYSLIKEKKLDLRPPYQRNYIWGKKDQQLLIDSIEKGYPLPSFFLYLKPDGLYEMVDGQQRAETICRFINGEITDSAKNKFNNIDCQRFLLYLLNITEISSVNESAGENISAFYALVNKQGMHLNNSEIFKAQYGGSKAMQLIDELLSLEEIDQLDLFATKTKSRMNDRSLIEELVAYLRSGFYDKRDAVVDYYESSLSDEEISKLHDEFVYVIKKIVMLNEVSPINQTRYRQRNDFFTLFTFIQNHQQIEEETLRYQYTILRWFDDEGFIRPSNEDCELLCKYALNCVAQSNSRKAREKRLEIFESILCHKENVEDDDYSQLLVFLMDYYQIKNVPHKNIGDFSLIDMDYVLQEMTL